MDKSNVGVLRQQLSDKELEIKQLSQELKASVGSERRAKAHLRNCLEEIVRLRRLRNEDHELRLKMEKKEVARLREEYTKKQAERKAMNMRNELMRIKSELSQALHSQPSPMVPMQANNNPGSAAASSFARHSMSGTTPSGGAQAFATAAVRSSGVRVGPGHKHVEEINRLEAERRDLLCSGVYREDSPLVQKLTARIVALANA
eukprot:CAMPEP_0197532124 /NCGR_PEP_ID=MMETSP1318-20131121/38609_1 /TAXON_ID=552666 /ORGANISM="Partenskyella glossopodia, Strain RCC365" /LENGTH=203 /DNA_ID=CAMNT_0043088589 /DNA_START=39 /DNA_END=650 /DNA_ORIENTATION=+